ncbi:recombinase RecT [Caballeronia sp. J97]|uniref:recombinase RecT n=1 Tax=Caballeronia sp. J97 TaxID=2805429 RepID=UPI002AAF5BB1|nr:recombinase RecT [Caballeronia sp. J97]
MSVNANIAAFRGDLDKQRKELEFVLPKHIDLGGFCRIVLTAVSANEKLASADRTSLLAACMEAAEDGLLPDGREGAIVPYFSKRANGYTASWQPMVWGLVKLVRQSGELRDPGAHVVTNADRFDYLVDEHGEHFRHRPDFAQSNAQPVLIYAFARTKDGGVYFEAMPWREVEKFRDLAQARSEDTPWHSWTDEMAKVRVLKRLCKGLPMSATARAALVRDDARDAQHFAPVSDAVDPVSAINATIRAGAASVPTLDAPALTPASTSELNQATHSSKRSRGARGKYSVSTDANPPQGSASPLSFTYAQVVERLNRAADLAELTAASKLIDSVADEQQREELYELSGQIAADFAAQAHDDDVQRS